jgi:hypothetical protein
MQQTQLALLTARQNSEKQTTRATAADSNCKAKLGKSRRSKGKQDNSANSANQQAEKTQHSKEQAIKSYRTREHAQNGGQS